MASFKLLQDNYSWLIHASQKNIWKQNQRKTTPVSSIWNKRHDT